MYVFFKCIYNQITAIRVPHYINTYAFKTLRLKMAI